MNKINGTKLVRQFIYLPNVVPLCDVLLVLLLLFFVSPLGCLMKNQGRFDLFDVRNGHVIGKVVKPKIKINHKGEIWLSGERFDLKDLSEFSRILRDEMEWNTYYEKVLMVVDQHVEFGRVQRVLKAAKKAGAKKVGLITNENAALHDFM